jgi:hypothetical protein
MNIRKAELRPVSAVLHYECALALAGHQNSGIRKLTYSYPKRRNRYSETFGEFRLVGEAVAWLPFTAREGIQNSPLGFFV